MFIDRYGIHLGIFTIHFYGLIIMLGVLGASFLTRSRSKKYGQDPERVWDMLTWLLIAGVIGARIWHVITPPPSMVERGITAGYYLTHPLDAIAIWRGGLGIPGAVIGGVLALYIYTRINKLSFAVWLDIIAPGLILAQAIGRWGNFVNQELYGAPSNLPWAIFIEPFYRLPQYASLEYYHPLFLYESLWNLATMFFLIWFGNKNADRLKTGDVFLIYLICYPVGRFLLEFLRLDSALVGSVNVNQTLMAVIACVSALAFLYRHRGDNREIPTDEPSETVE